MLTQWVNQTWKEFHKKNSELIHQTFKKPELSLAVDESKNHELFIKNISDVTIEDWRLLKDKKKQIIDDLNDSKNVNKMNEIKMMKNDKMRSKKNVEYVLKDELLESRNSDSEFKNASIWVQITNKLKHKWHHQKLLKISDL